MLGSVDCLGNSVVWIVTPWARALGGRKVRNRRAAFACLEKGLNLVLTSVRKREIIVIFYFVLPWAFWKELIS